MAKLPVYTKPFGPEQALIEQWLGADAARVIPNAEQFQRPQLLR